MLLNLHTGSSLQSTTEDYLDQIHGRRLVEGLHWGYSEWPRDTGFFSQWKGQQSVIDYATSEALTLDSLYIELPCAFIGPGCGGGAFSQRHAALHDQVSALLTD